MGSGWRAVARRWLHGAGALAGWHRLRHADTLTVVLFHRVLADGAPAWPRVDPRYALSASAFRFCLAFLARHYNAVDLADIRASRAGGGPLPRRAVLISFDDGWADTLETAAPILEEFGLPAVLFAATDAMRDEADEWWQERAARLCRNGQAPRPSDHCGVGWETATGDDFLDLLGRLRGLPQDERDRLLDDGLEAGAREMLSPEGLRRWRACGFAVGAHGAEHMPLTALADDAVTRDLERSRDEIGRMTGEAVAALSFPHGRYDGRVVGLARQCGFELLFTSEPCINARDAAGRPGELLGRIAIPEAAFRDGDGQLRADRLASWLFTRPLRRLHA